MNYSNASTDRYTDMMLEHTSVAIAVYDAKDLCLLEANTHFLTILDTFLSPEWQHGKIIGHAMSEWIREAQNLAIMDIYHKVVETGIPYRGTEFALSTLRRPLSYWNWSLDPVKDAEGQITHLIMTGTEVTTQVLERQQAEQARAVLSQTNKVVEAERKRLEVIDAVARGVRESLDTARIGNIAIHAIRTHFNANSSCLHIADPVHKVLRLLCAYTPPSNEAGEEARKVQQYVPYEHTPVSRQALRQREPIAIEDMQAAAATGKMDPESALLHPGARGYICVPLWFGDHFEGTLAATFPDPISSDGPEVSALQGSGTHIAAALAHARLHAHVESEHARLRSILDQLPEGILIAEVSNGAISYANPTASQVLGMPLKELTELPLHQHPWSRVAEEGTPGDQSLLPWNFAVIRALCGETIRSKETIVIRPDGRRAITLTSSAPLYAENGFMTGAMIVFQDVTAQKSLEQHKNEFLSIANHELRTPITVIQGFAEILQIKAKQSDSLDPITQYALTSIAEQSEHLTRLIEEMLDISRIEEARFILKRTPCDLMGIIARVIESQAITTRRHELRFALEGIEASDTLVAHIDEERMTQVLNNLVSNAIKYSPTGGNIEIGLRHTLERPHEILIWIKDHGIGIAAHEIPNIFKRFHRASNIDSSLSGFGIGLYLVKEVVVRHGGRVWAESTEGEGSTFYVILPLPTVP
ncbi:MAG: PAS domain-containing protein [Chloroflexi bacterium]|nr:PAS domain-containing protein [Chloroflexota bacterium]